MGRPARGHAVGLDEGSPAMSGLARRLVRALPPGPLRLLRALRSATQTWDPRRLVRHRRFLRLNRDAGPSEMVLRPGLRLDIAPEARESFEWFCFRSLEMADELDAFLARGRDRYRFLDVGACHGLFSLAFTQGRPGAEAVAVEPSLLARDVLESNLRRNPEARVTPVQAALGASPGTLVMRYSWHHLEASPEAAGDPGAVEVPVRTLDDLREELGFHPDMVKIDVEGYEIAVLRGALRMLREDRPILFLEVHPERIVHLGGSMGEIAGLLDDLGYAVLDLAGRPARLTTTAVSRFLCEPHQGDIPRGML
jgi:FkbM family methyltransferase